MENKFVLSPRVLDDLGWGKLLGTLADFAMTTRGVERAHNLPFLNSKQEVERSFELIQEVRHLIREELPLPLGGIDDVGELLRRAAKGATLDSGEVLACGRLIRAAADIKKFLSSLREVTPLIAEYAEDLAGLAPLASRIQSTIEPNGLIRDDASYELQMYREQTRSLHRQMKRKIESYLGDTQIEDVLQDQFYSVRGERYVLPIKSSERSKMPGIVHNASNSGQTIFVEPQVLVPLGNELTIAQSCVSDEEQKVLAEFSADIGEHYEALETSLTVLAQLDVIQASAKLSNQLEATPPSLLKPKYTQTQSEPAFYLNQLRHPLLILQGESVVPNTVALGESERALVISGPNAGGKTVTMTAIGLCALMIRAGLPIPAEEGTSFPFLTGLASAVGDAQDIEQQLSTFSAHLTYLAGALRHACDGWLVLVDEIASDTDPVEGAALAQAVLEQLTEQGAVVVVTTHLEEIKAMGINDSRFVNARVGLDPKSGQPTYALELKLAGISNALDVAARVGLPEVVLNRAQEHLSGRGALTMALKKLEEEHRDQLVLRENLEEQLRQSQRAHAKLKQEREALARKRAELELSIRAELGDEIEELRHSAREIMRDLRGDKSLKKAQEANQALLAKKKKVSERQDELEGVIACDEDSTLAPIPDSIEPGMRVVLSNLKKEAEVVAVDGNRIQVAMGALKMSVKKRDLMALKLGKPGSAKDAPRPKRTADNIVSGTVESPNTRCDVRGARADDALSQVEAFLDQSYNKGASQILVVHGHGTGALKKAVRQSLEFSPYVRGFRPGKSHEGGDGVTVVELDC